MNEGFEGIMTSNVRNGLQLKKDKELYSMPLKVLRMDGAGMEKVTFKEVNEFHLPDSYTLVGTCSIRGVEHTFEHSAPPYGLHNSTIIGFLPIKQPARV